MKLNYSITGAERKSLVTAISQILNITPKYLGMPSAAYEIGSYIVTRTGGLIGEDNRELITALKQQGFTAVSDEYDDAVAGTDEYPDIDQHHPGRYANPNEPVTKEMQKQIDEYYATFTNDDEPANITIELTAENVREDILRSLIESKSALIKAALGDDGSGELPIEFYDGKVAFNGWLRFGVDGDTVKAWSTFLAAMVRYSMTAKRINAKDRPVENEKFSFRTLIVKIGLNSLEHKWLRKRLMRNLSGDSAFATPESKEKWFSKHGRKSDDTES